MAGTAAAHPRRDADVAQIDHDGLGERLCEAATGKRQIKRSLRRRW
jgi:hypothetical protein